MGYYEFMTLIETSVREKCLSLWIRGNGDKRYRSVKTSLNINIKCYPCHLEVGSLHENHLTGYHHSDLRYSQAPVFVTVSSFCCLPLYRHCDLYNKIFFYLLLE